MLDTFLSGCADYRYKQQTCNVAEMVFEIDLVQLIASDWELIISNAHEPIA